ncbi:MAG: hypothetical protein AB7D47_04300 [Desulfovibrio sp.]|jgi:hypothetical protein
MKYARISDKFVSEVWGQRPILHPDIEIVEVANEVAAGWIVDADGDIIPPAKPETFEVWDKTAGGYTMDTEAKNAARRAEIVAQLGALDAAAVRPLRAVAAGTATPEDTDMIEQIEANALALRDELAGLTEV